MRRNATAVWEGSGKDGKGTLSTQSTSLQDFQYSFSSRFEQGVGTNPEELVAAAHAGCFSMKLSFVLNEAGFTADRLEAKCVITLGDGAITSSEITLSATVPGIDDAKFAECVKEAELNCPISKLLDTEISVEYTLNG